ncbi:Protein cramped-like, variant 2 [Schistosoma haematobium]|nr:Protein cramped-like, variant 2 [Schistosoma haematobium]KAH9587632.1 Protein cramped-like, variant 2 [Schistosoma haematobium]
MNDLLLVSTETNQCSMSSSSFSNDTLASLLNTLCPRCPLSSTHDNQNILTESSARPTDSTLSPLNELSTPDLHKTTFSTPTTNDVNVSLKIEENAEKSFDFRTIDSVCSYPPVSPSIGDISFTDSMAAAVMDVHHMELDHSDGEQSTDVHSEPLNLIASNLIIQPDVYPIRPSYESLVEHDDIKTRGISRSEYNCITNVEVFLRMNTPQSRRNSVGLNSTLQIPTTSSS